MKLSALLKSETELLNQIDKAQLLKVSDYEINKISNNLRDVTANSLFFGIKGFSVDAAKFIPDVIDKGVKVIITHDKAELPGDIPQDVVILKTGEIKDAMGRVLSKFYDKKPEHIAAVTGTNGKTTTATLVRQMTHQLMGQGAAVGTLGVQYNVNGEEGSLKVTGTLTNPDLIDIHRYLQELKEKGVDYVATEASSQAMADKRLAGINIEVGAFTSFARDHIGEGHGLHKNMDEYLRCKLLLFSEVMKEGSVAVLNADIAEYSKIREVCEKRNHRIISYGKGEDCYIRIANVEYTAEGYNVTFIINGNRELKIVLKMIGEFQAYNLACAMGMLIGFGSEDRLGEIEYEKLIAAKGRAEFMGELPNGAKVYMDYPTTPDALESTIKSFKNYQKQIGGGRVIILFGAGGDKDAAKRPIMGKIATELADLAIISDDSPRTEDPHKIIRDIMEGCKDKSKAVAIQNRTEAVKYGISILQKGDILVTNKGHERHITIGAVDVPYDEEKLIKDIIKGMNNL